MQTQKNGKTCIHALSTYINPERKRQHRIDAYESEDSAEDDDVEEEEEEGALRAIGRSSDRASICFVFKILPVLLCDAVNHRGAHLSSSLRCFVCVFFRLHSKHVFNIVILMILIFIRICDTTHGHTHTHTHTHKYSSNKCMKIISHDISIVNASKNKLRWYDRRTNKRTNKNKSAFTYSSFCC